MSNESNDVYKPRTHEEWVRSDIVRVCIQETSFRDAEMLLDDVEKVVQYVLNGR